MPMKLLPIFLILTSFYSNAEEDCIFDESAYLGFISKYQTENRNSLIEPDTKTLSVKRENEDILVTGGGCIHLGGTIELKAKNELTEAQFLQKTLDLSIEFGSWVINTSALRDSIGKGKYLKTNGIYTIEVDAMTVFEASYDSQGKININFYVN
jgi:hypothetical protein